MNKPGFWNDTQAAQKSSRRLSLLKRYIESDQRLSETIDDLELELMLIEEDDSEDNLQEAVRHLGIIIKNIEKIEVQFLLNEPNDPNGAILNIHPGAGGTESQDWAEMLLRMYNRWAEKNNYSFTIIDYQAGDEAGIKNVTIEIVGDFAYGYLKAEIGVHRLVRLSPYNSQNKRQTSFASVFIYPILDDDIEVEIDPKDLRIDTYRSSGAGGQHVNKTDSAVRLTHLPTNIIVQCQNQRSQIKNKAEAMKILKSRLYQYYEEIRAKEKAKLENTKTDIGWGNQIRSYVFHPYQMVKDHRTSHEIGNTGGVMDGDIFPFINAFLKYKAILKRSDH